MPPLTKDGAFGNVFPASGWERARNSENVKQLCGFLNDAPAESRPRGKRLGNKVIKLQAEANGKKVKIKASSPQELEPVVKAIQELVEPDDNSI